MLHFVGQTIFKSQSAASGGAETRRAGKDATSPAGAAVVGPSLSRVQKTEERLKWPLTTWRSGRAEV